MILRIVSILFPIFAIVAVGYWYASRHDPERGDKLLAEGIRQFEDANYPAATRSLQGALAEGLSH